MTLWGPTHLMLIGGAGMTLIGQAILLREGRPRHEPALDASACVAYVRRVSLMGGLLIGLSTFQAEFDFGVPQFHMVFQPMLIAIAAGIALVAARIWIGPGGALGAVVFFLVVRGGISLIVGPVFGETTPALPLYLAEAALRRVGRALIHASGRSRSGPPPGARSGRSASGPSGAGRRSSCSCPGTRPSARRRSSPRLAAGVAGGLVGGLLGAGLRGKLPQPRVAAPPPWRRFAVDRRR